MISPAFVSTSSSAHVEATQVEFARTGVEIEPLDGAERPGASWTCQRLPSFNPDIVEVVEVRVAEVGRLLHVQNPVLPVELVVHLRAPFVVVEGEVAAKEIEYCSRGRVDLQTPKSMSSFSMYKMTTYHDTGTCPDVETRPSRTGR